MNTRRVACLLLGIWMGGSLLMALVATHNFQSINRTLDEPTIEVEQAVQRLGGIEQARLFLRHHVGEQNRFNFEHWEMVQIALGIGLFLLLLFGTQERKRILGLSLAMVLLTVFAHILVTPSITGLGRELDFVPSSVDSPLRSRFRAWHMAYSALEVVKLILGVLLGLMLVTGNGGRRRESMKEPHESEALRR